MKTCVTIRLWLCVLGVLGAIAAGANDFARAQIVPDASLGTENSVVTPNLVIRGLPSDRIDGGAIRGSNLFHSFERFNIGAGRGAYFSNPAGIENILSRVTGNSRSEILGRLGVLGSANLFLINPNGIIFGPNASLDVAGSFTATTANAITLGDQGLFSASQPESSKLLAIAPGALFFDQQVRQPKTIQNSGSLTTGRDLTLAADNLELQGQLQSGGDLTLHAQDTLRIRDSVTNPFIAAAGGKLLVQGDRSVDIFALSHPNSGLFSGGDMVLRSTTPISGDSHFMSGGNFRVEQLDKSPGSLISLNDPVIQALGDVLLLDYEGASLQILAGGSVFILGPVTITGAGGGFNDSQIQLSDGTVRTVLGSTIPILEIRAGTTEFFLASPLFTGILPPSGSDIVISGNITMPAFGGVVLTNQIAPNLLVPPGVIVTRDIQTAGGEAILDSSGGILVAGNIDVSIAGGTGGDITLFGGLGGIDTRGGTLESFSDNGNAGNIKLTANQNILTAGIQSYVSAGGTGDGGDITISSRNGIVDTTAGTLYSSTPNGRGGTVEINAAGDIRTAGIQSLLAFQGNGSAGNIVLTSQFGSIDTTAFAPGFNGNLLSGIQSLVGDEATGYGGNVTLTALRDITTSDIESLVGTGSTGFAGNITLYSALGSINTIAGVLSSSTDNGFSGKITLDAFGDIVTGDVQAFSTGKDFGRAGDIFITSAAGNFFLSGNRITSQGAGTATSGNININANSIFLTNKASITSSSFGTGGEAGRVFLQASRTVSLNNSTIFSALQQGAVGEAGEIFILGDSISLENKSQLQVQTSGTGDGGRVFLQASGKVSLNDSIIFNSVEPRAVGDAGGIFILGGSISLDNEAQLQAQTYGIGDAGRVFLQASGKVSLSNGSKIFNSVEPRAVGDAGGIFILGGSISLDNEAQLQAQTYGIGDAGRVFLQASGKVSLNDSAIFSSVEPRATGNAGGIFISGASIFLNNVSELQAQTYGTGDAGLVFLRASGTVSLDNGSGIFSSVQSGANGSAGDIVIDTGELLISNQSRLIASTSTTNSACLGIGGCNAGLIFIRSIQGTSLNNSSRIRSEVGENALGIAGGIRLKVGSFSASNNSRLSTSTSGRGDAGFIFVESGKDISLSGSGSGIFSSVINNSTSRGGEVKIRARDIFVKDRAEISVDHNGRDGEAGNISIDTRQIELDRGAKISGTTLSGNGGNITINASKSLLLRRSSNISTTAGQRPAGGDGGNITITTPFIIATPSRDSNITAEAYTGTGGAITINGIAFFGIARRSQDFPTSNDITTSSRFGLSGITTVNALDGSVLENSLTEFSESLVDPNALLANSCIVRNREKNRGQSGTFLVTGSGGLPVRPGDPLPSAFPTGDVRTVPEAGSREEGTGNSQSWKLGDPIVEPQGVYRLPNGRLVMSRECEP